MDLIDRQAVIDLLKQMRKDGDMVPWEGKNVFARIRMLPALHLEERTEKRMETHACDLISRQAAIEAYGDWYVEEGTAEGFIGTVKQLLEGLPSAQPEPSIPLSWIEKHIEWLKSLDNEFANLAATHISVMVKKWRGEQE